MRINARHLFLSTLLAGVSALAEAGPQPLFHESFAAGKLDGPVGKAAAKFSVDARGIFNAERGTLAFFIKPEKAPAETEWQTLGGVNTRRHAGYWEMFAAFQTRKSQTVFNFFDIGFYAPPLLLPSIIGRWQADQWHHLCAVWDRERGITVYEDGRQVAGNWGNYRWEWSQTPHLLKVNWPVDEVWLSDQCLTAAQVAQLAAGQAPTGEAIPLVPEEERRPRELERRGWSGASLEALPRVAAGTGTALSFARIRRCVDAKRPVAYPHEGFLGSTWPSHKYGASIRGQRLDIELESEARFDRVRVFAQREFVVALASVTAGQDEPVAEINAPRAGFCHLSLGREFAGGNLALLRHHGQMGQIDFYRSAPFAPPATPTATACCLAKAAAFPDSDQGKYIMAETPRRFWNPVLLAAAGSEVPAWTLETPAFGGFQAFAEEPREKGVPLDGVLVKLTVGGLSGPTPVQIQVKEPVHPERLWLAADVVLEPAGNGVQNYFVQLTGRPVAVMPPLRRYKYLGNGKYAAETNIMPGLGIAVAVTAASPAVWQMGAGGCAVSLLPSADSASALAKAVDDQVEYMREGYAENMEGHEYAEPQIQKPLLWLAVYARERMEFRQMWERVDTSKPKLADISIEPLVWTEPKNDTAWPDWVFWQKQAMNRVRRHVHWIIDNKQVWTGEFGGIWNDDSTHIENWMGYALALDGSGKIKKALDKYWDGLWRYHLTEGVGKYTQDVGHYSEEGSSNLGMRFVVDYGNPVAYARTMQAASHIPAWLRPDGQGGMTFKSWWVGPDGAWTDGAFDRGTQRPPSHSEDVLVPLGYLIWYNRHPAAAELLKSLKVRNMLLGPALDLVTDPKGAREEYARKLLEPVKVHGHAAHSLYVNEVGFTEATRAKHAAAYKPLPKIEHYGKWQASDMHWWIWLTSGQDSRAITDSYKRLCEWFYSHDWLNSEAMPSMDRCPLPRTALIRSRLGATVANRGSSGVMWPQHAISFTRGADEVAALFMENLPNRFTVRLYPFTAAELPLQIRIWRCHGRFQAVLASDKDDDGRPDTAIWTRELELERGSFMDLTLPPGQASILTVTPLEVREPDFDLPDPAIAVESMELVYGGHLVVQVYNNGSRPVENVLVRVRDARTGLVVPNGEANTGPIEAPLDLKPRWKRVEFKNLDGCTWGSLIVEIDPEQKVPDLNRHNNRVELKYRGTFTLDEGWR